MDVFGKLHPFFSHFPIALLVAALIAEVVSFFGGNNGFKTAGKFCLFLGAVSCIPAVISGFVIKQIRYGDAENAMVTGHQNQGLAATGFAIFAIALALVLGKKLKGATFWLYLALVVAAAAAVMWTGHTGGIIVFGEW